MISKLQDLMKHYNINYYIIPTDDDHQSESVGDYYQVRMYLSGFKGSAGTLLVTQDQAYMWTDGRYFIQAAKELNDGIKLMKMNTEGYPSLYEFLYENAREGDTIGFDGRVLNARAVLDLKEMFKDQVNIRSIDLITPIWVDRPPMSHSKVFLYDKKYHGKEARDKLSDIRKILKKENCDAHVLSTLDDIAYIFNIRGHDIECTPLVLSYALITMNEAYLYLQNDVYDETIESFLKEQGVTIKSYYEIYEDVKLLKGTILVDLANINYELVNSIPGTPKDTENPSQYMKCIKNDVEIKNTINAHIKDGVAVTKFMYWLKKNIGKIEMDEYSVAEYLTNLRAQQDLFIEPSFTTISAYQENAALMHYHAEKEDATKLKEEGMLLVDSGGHYYDGTTDITRTFVLGPISDLQKKHFTIVLKAVLDLQKTHFLYGQTGVDLDVLARNPIWCEDIDYQCGTGHGVGHLSVVHEGPNEFRPKTRYRQATVMEEGMITTDEPGIYLENQYGIRTENELLCVKGTKNEYGQFMHFKCLTLVPIDLDAIDKDLLSYDEINALNDYHKEVYETISPYLNDDERIWLKEYTREI